MAPRTVACAATLLVALFFGTSYGSVATAAGNDCMSAPRISSLETTADSTLTLGLRRELLGITIGCALKDALLLAAELKDAPVPQADLEVHRAYSEFEATLSDIIAALQVERDRVPQLTLAETKERARVILAERARAYHPTAKTIAHFIIWAKNHESLLIAEGRLAQMTQSIQALGLDAVQDIRTLLEQAKNNLQYAQVHNRHARQIFVGNQSPDDFPYLTKDSLESLSYTYELFFALQQSVLTELLGT